MTVKNKNYIEFLSTGLMKTLDIEHVQKAFENIPENYKHKAMLRSFVITSYYTGARPVEILGLHQGDVYKDSGHVVFKMPGAKNGKSRLIYVSLRRKLMHECLEYSWNQFPGILIYYNLIGNTRKQYVNKKGEVKYYIEKTARLRHAYKKMFDGVVDGGINPYYLRHNNFSKLSMKGASIGDIKIMKGGKSIKCAEYYIHMNVKKAKQLSRINK